VPNTGSVFAERVMGGNYVEFLINRDEIARYGLRVRDVQDVLEVALGGMPLTTTVEGLERYAINLDTTAIFVKTSRPSGKSSSQLRAARKFHSANLLKSKSSAPL
jgi:Cu/Ag efflux pump CusA